ncbi:MAG: Nramp family divalent metal transporter [Ramlibacter sp.]
MLDGSNPLTPTMQLPRLATAPFCPSEIQGTVRVAPGSSLLQRLLRVAGPGLLVAVGYMDPGNWATDIEAGSRFGFALLWVVLGSSLAAMLLQTLSLRLGLVTGQDLAQACRVRYPATVHRCLWLLAELSIIACDVAEVLGSALALHLLFHVPLVAGILITAFDTLLVLGLQGKGFRQVEALVLALIVTIGACFAIELVLVRPDWPEFARGAVPSLDSLLPPGGLLLAVGILGATVMPHNLYLHSSIVQTRRVDKGDVALRDVIRLSTLDTVLALSLALVVNAAILALAASAFHATGHGEVKDIQDAYQLLDPLVGGALASVLFGLALLAAGQSATLTGTIAGQVLMEGFLQLKIPCYQRRLITRGLALIPALLSVLWMGDAGVGTLLVASQVVLSLQLPFAVWPLLRITSDRALMREHANGWLLKVAGVAIFTLITGANAWLLWQWLS